MDDLFERLQAIHTATQRVVVQTAHRGLVLRNWLWGAEIYEAQQLGRDRAEYGTQLLRNLAQRLREAGHRGLGFRSLNDFRQFALTYPEPAIVHTLCAQFADKDIGASAAIVHTLCAQFEALARRAAEHERFPWQDAPYYGRLFSSLSWSHLREFMRVDDPLARAFYEVESLKHGWSVRELKRQRDSMLFERVGLSKNKDAVLAFAKTGELVDTPEMTVRDPYVLEFLGLADLESYSESDLESRLVQHLEKFLLELGTDFALVGRQKRFSLDGHHFRIDLLFYHTRLKCHVVIELKTTEFRPEYTGQLNFYLNYVKNEIAGPDDNPPIGILLCTEKSAAVVEYATAGIDQQLFVSRYLKALPSKDELSRFVSQERELLEAGVEREP